MKLEPDNIIWSTYTDPELAHVGLTEKQLQGRNISYKTYRFPFEKIDRAVTESLKTGLIKVYAKEFNGKIYGADIVGAEAGEMINEFALAIKNKITLRKLADTMHAYPTYLLGNRRAADQWYVQKQSRFFVNLLQKLFGYRGKLPDTSDPERIV
jgi:pyruvate/2-oxoglutarate dehydrogenase complex dihydrolipoamide dehydrogenase (E3) component